jgi:hypothetical protein
MRRIFALTILSIFLVIPQSFALVPLFSIIDVNVACDGNVSILVEANAGNPWTLTIDGSIVNSGTAGSDTFTVTGSLTPQENHIFTLGLTVDGQTRTLFTNTNGCIENIPPIVCADGRINEECDIVAIYPIEDDDGIHIQVWYVLPDDSANGQFAFMLYADELDALPDNPDEAILIASSSDDFVKLYWMPDNTYQINAGPDSEGKIRVFVFDTFPGTVEVYTEE